MSSAKDSSLVDRLLGSLDSSHETATNRRACQHHDERKCPHALRTSIAHVCTANPSHFERAGVYKSSRAHNTGAYALPTTFRVVLTFCRMSRVLSPL